MFDKPYTFTFVQKNKSRNGVKRHAYEYIYKFYIHKNHSCRKYIVEVKEYDRKLFTLDFYAKTPSDHLNQKYRLKTNQFSGGRLGATILTILKNVFIEHGVIGYGMAGAALPNENTNEFTKRFQIYVKILRRATKTNFEVFENKKNSFIFIIHKEHVEDKEQIFSEYEQILREIL